MNRILILALLLVACDGPNPPPRIEHPVTDLANVLSPADRESLSQRLVAARGSVQIALLTVPTTDGEPIEDFSHRTAEAWAGGQAGRDNGVLVTIAVMDHRSRIEVGRGLEAALPDSYCSSLLVAAQEALRAGNYRAAFDGIVSGIVSRTESQPVPSPGPAQEPRSISSPQSPPQLSPRPDPSPDGSLWGGLIGIAMVLGLGGIGTWMFAKNRKDQRDWQEQDRQRELDRERREQERNGERKIVTGKIVVQSDPTPPYRPAPALDALVAMQRERQRAKPMQPSYSYKSETKQDLGAEDRSRRAQDLGAENRRREREDADRREEEDRARRRHADDSSSSSSSSSSDSGSSWGGGGGGFDGGGSSGSW